MVINRFFKKEGYIAAMPELSAILNTGMGLLSIHKFIKMNIKTLYFITICFLVFLLTSSCKNSKKKEIQNPIIKTEEFSTDISDGEYLIDSSAGVKTYAVVEGKKLKKFRATTFDGKLSKIGYVTLQISKSLFPKEQTEEQICISLGGKWVCTVPIVTGDPVFCACTHKVSPTTPEQGIWGLVDMLGPSFSSTNISGLHIKLTLELDDSVPPRS